jgi:hypothetical protein
MPTRGQAGAASGSHRYLIVNADDFGYFPCVSQGIIEAARAGVVTATSVMANRPHVDMDSAALAQLTSLDVGVHLNLTAGEPLTEPLRNRFGPAGFPGKLWWALRSAGTGRLLRDVADELRAQITACARLGLRVCFLNSHEHVHMLPRLLPMVHELAEEFRIAFVRDSRPDRLFAARPSAFLRNTLLQALSVYHHSTFAQSPMPRMLGMSASGKLDLDHLKAITAKLKPGMPAELMCHPGLCSSGDVGDPRLNAYHAWTLEYATLTGDAFAELLHSERIELVGFSHFA